jgi:hypothetical protein
MTKNPLASSCRQWMLTLFPKTRTLKKWFIFDEKKTFLNYINFIVLESMHILLMVKIASGLEAKTVQQLERTYGHKKFNQLKKFAQLIMSKFNKTVIYL